MLYLSLPFSFQTLIFLVYERFCSSHTSIITSIIILILEMFVGCTFVTYLFVLIISGLLIRLYSVKDFHFCVHSELWENDNCIDCWVHQSSASYLQNRTEWWTRYISLLEPLGVSRFTDSSQCISCNNSNHCVQSKSCEAIMTGSLQVSLYESNYTHLLFY